MIPVILEQGDTLSEQIKNTPHDTLVEYVAELQRDNLTLGNELKSLRDKTAKQGRRIKGLVNAVEMLGHAE